MFSNYFLFPLCWLGNYALCWHLLVVPVGGRFSVGLSWFCASCWQTPTTFAPGSLYKDACIWTVLEDGGGVSRVDGGSAYSLVSSSRAELKQICVLTIKKYSSSLHSGFLSFNATWAGVTWPSSCHPVGTGSQGIGTEANTLAAAVAVSHKSPFVFGPGILCLLPASMKLCRLACPFATRAQSETLHSSQWNSRDWNTHPRPCWSIIGTLESSRTVNRS